MQARQARDRRDERANTGLSGESMPIGESYLFRARAPPAEEGALRGAEGNARAYKELLPLFFTSKTAPHSHLLPAPTAPPHSRHSHLTAPAPLLDLRHSSAPPTHPTEPLREPSFSHPLPRRQPPADSSRRRGGRSAVSRRGRRVSRRPPRRRRVAAAEES
jgi:hypothetical protein